MIIHIAKKSEYEKAIKTGYYSQPSLLKEGFIHCSTLEQVIKVANNNFKDESDLCLLYIDEEKLSSKLLYEDLFQLNEKYPHIYGPINYEAITMIKDFKEKNGTFKIPD